MNILIIIPGNSIEEVHSSLADKLSGPTASIVEFKSSARYSQFGTKEASILLSAAEELAGPRVYLKSVEKKVHTSLGFLGGFLASESPTVSSFFETREALVSTTANFTDEQHIVLDAAIFKRMCIYGLHMDLCAYSIDGFRNTYLPNLVLGLKRTYGLRFCDDFKKICSAVIEQLQATHKISDKQYGSDGAHPMMPFDADHIFSHMPNGWEFRFTFKAHVSIGLNCGARGVSLCAVTWNDISDVTVQKTEAGLFYQFTLTLKKTKGGRINHTLRFEGFAGDFRATNAAYHMNMLCLDVFNITLDNLSSIPKIARNALVFQCSTPDVFSGRVSMVSKYSGYGEHFFTAHSLRSGFICTATIQKYLSVGKVVGGSAQNSDILFTTGIVGLWVPGSNAQVGYLKDVMRQTIVASRLVGSSPLDTPGLSEDDKLFLINTLGVDTLYFS